MKKDQFQNCPKCGTTVLPKPKPCPSCGYDLSPLFSPTSALIDIEEEIAEDSHYLYCPRCSVKVASSSEPCCNCGYDLTNLLLITKNSKPSLLNDKKEIITPFIDLIQLEEKIEIPLILNLHQIKHFIKWFQTQTSINGTSDCEDHLAQTLGNAIGNFGNYGFTVFEVI